MGRVPIGRPIANTQAHVLDAALRPVPSGVGGELFLGGLGVAQGYLDRPDLTAERFVPNPYGPPGSRLYRTGDLARRLPSGSLDLIGRVDQQVKIRGHRIEPGEIESRLAEHPGVLQAAVSARADAHGEPHLVAYLVCAGAPPAVAELRQFLRSRLPETMVPAIFVVLERLPLTASGKVDRGALPAPDAGRLESGRTYRAPETATERALAEVWGELLGHDRGRDGRRLLRARRALAAGDAGRGESAGAAVARAAPALDLREPHHRRPRQHPRRHPDRHRAGRRDPRCGGHPATPTESPPTSWTRLSSRTTGSEPPHMSRDDDVTALPLSFAQERLWFLDQLIPGSPAYTIFDAVRLRGPLDVTALGRSLTELVRRHEILRSTFPSVAGRPVQIAQPPAPLEVPLTDLSQVAPEQREAELDASARRGGRAAALAHVRTRAPGRAVPAGRRGARAVPRHPPHRVRRLVRPGAPRRSWPRSTPRSAAARTRRCPSPSCSSPTTPSGSASG